MVASGISALAGALDLAGKASAIQAGMDSMKGDQGTTAIDPKAEEQKKKKRRDSVDLQRKQLMGSGDDYSIGRTGAKGIPGGITGEILG